MSFTFLSISDLHMSRKNIDDIKIVLNALWEDIQKIEDNIDMIFLTGDLICNGAVGFEEDEQYDMLDTYFIQPLLKNTKVKKENVFIVPGNHEINRKRINFIYKDLNDKFNNREAINKFIDNLKDYHDAFNRLEDYNIFKDIFYEGNKNIITSNELFTTHIVNFNEYKIGVACLNSSWLSTEEKKDYGRLILGERQIDKALSDIEKCDFKVALMHHPIQYLKQFDQQDLVTKLIYDFDIVITGHTHQQDINNIVGCIGSNLRIKNAALFNGRAYNGYSIIKFDKNTNEVEVSLREYFDKRRKFDKAISIIEDGKYYGSLKQDNTLEEKKNTSKALKNIENKLFQDIDNRLLTTISSDTVAPKEIEKIFVSPFMAEKPEGTDDIEQESVNKFNVEETLNSTENMLFIGKKEYGKTTLLNYICKKALCKYKLESICIPVIINFKEMPKGIDNIKKAISNFLSIYNATDINIEENLINGNFFILIDNLDTKNSKNISRLQKFTTTYSNNRYMFCMNEELLQTIKIESLPDIGIEYKTLYMYSFKRGQVRQLVAKWFEYSTIEYREKVLNKIMNSIKEISVPQTPFMISLMLFIVEKQASYNPINEASLVEKFLEIILEKLNLNEITYNSFDYKDKMDYLAYIASTLVRKNHFFFTISDIYNETQIYCSKKGVEIDYQELIEFFISKGILIKISNKIYFRFTCFLEFFIAKYMSIEKNKDFKLLILSEENYLKYTNEIIYFVGLNRQDYSTIKLIEDRLIESFEKIDEFIHIEDYIKIKTSPVIKELINGKLISKKELDGLRLSNEEKDELLENPLIHNKRDYTIKKKKNWNFKESFIENLELYSKIIKNSGLLDITEKCHALELCINKYCKLLGLLYKIFFEIILDKIEKNKSENTKINEEERKKLLSEFKDIIAITMPIVMQFIILDNLGSPKFKVTIEKLISTTKTEFEKFMLVSLYSDMKLPEYWKKLENLISEASSSFFQQLIFTKLLIYNAMFIVTESEAEEIAKLIEKLKVKMTSEGKSERGEIKQYSKNRVISHNLSKERKKRLIEKYKK